MRAVLMIALAACLAVSACGKKGDPSPPSEVEEKEE